MLQRTHKYLLQLNEDVLYLISEYLNVNDMLALAATSKNARMIVGRLCRRRVYAALYPRVRNDQDHWLINNHSNEDDEWAPLLKQYFNDSGDTDFDSNNVREEISLFKKETPETVIDPILELIYGPFSLRDNEMTFLFRDKETTRWIFIFSQFARFICQECGELSYVDLDDESLMIGLVKYQMHLHLADKGKDHAVEEMKHALSEKLNVTSSRGFSLNRRYCQSIECTKRGSCTYCQSARGYCGVCAHVTCSSCHGNQCGSCGEWFCSDCLSMASDSPDDTTALIAKCAVSTCGYFCKLCCFYEFSCDHLNRRPLDDTVTSTSGTDDHISNTNNLVNFNSIS